MTDLIEAWIMNCFISTAYLCVFERIFGSVVPVTVTLCIMMGYPHVIHCDGL